MNRHARMALTNYPVFGDNRIPFDVSRLNENKNLGKSKLNKRILRKSTEYASNMRNMP